MCFIFSLELIVGKNAFREREREKKKKISIIFSSFIIVVSNYSVFFLRNCTFCDVGRGKRGGRGAVGWERGVGGVGVEGRWRGPLIPGRCNL